MKANVVEKIIKSSVSYATILDINNTIYTPRKYEDIALITI